MQTDVITLAVDLENDGGTPTDVVYRRFEAYQNRSLYIGAAHALNARDTLGFYRTLPKPNGNFRGVAKTSMKFTFDVTVDGVDGVSQITAPIIVEVSCSLPVGATTAQAKAARQKAAALLDRDDVAGELQEQLMI